jgi:hypothetical protein
MKIYPILDSPSKQELLALGVSSRLNVRAVRTGEFRPPNAGEWYLSGALVDAYCAPNDLPDGCNHHIARLCVIETITRIVR